MTTIESQIKFLKEEFTERYGGYANLVALKMMSREEAAAKRQRMDDVIATLESLTTGAPVSAPQRIAMGRRAAP